MNRKQAKIAVNRQSSLLGKVLFLAVLIAVLGSVLPAAAQITVRGKLAHDLDVTPGMVVTGSIMVDNDSDAMQEAKVYLRDYMFYADGTNAYDDPGTVGRSNAPWVRFTPESMRIPPRTSVAVNYEITVPDTTGPGSYWSILMVEGVDASSAESTEGAASERQVGFRQVTRYGVQLALHYKENAEQSVSFDNIQLLVDENGKTFFQVDISNSGGLMLHPNVYLRVFDADGAEFGPFQGSLYRMYPETSVRHRIELAGLASGTYQALLIVDNGEDAVFGGQYELTL